MATLKMWRIVAFAAFFATLIVGFAFVLRGELVIFAVAFGLASLLARTAFRLHRAIQRAEVESVEARAREIADAVKGEQWSVAVALSEQSVATMTAAADRAESGPSADRPRMRAALALTMVNHGILLGANGQREEAQEVLDEWIHQAEPLVAQWPEMTPLFQAARKCQFPRSPVEDFRESAHLFPTFLAQGGPLSNSAVWGIGPA
jgi:hypothetical protein